MTAIDTRAEFVKLFGEADADAVVRAADRHRMEFDGCDKGTDPFRNDLMTCVAFECLSEPRYRNAHGFTAPWDAIREFLWARRDWMLADDGAHDRLRTVLGGYDAERFAPGGDECGCAAVRS